MEGRELQHFFHEHPLILKAEEHKTNGGNDHPEAEIKCDGCRIPISGPFYSCGECPYFLHKVCAELPSELEHPLHPEHPLTLLSDSAYINAYDCSLCKELSYNKDESRFTYHCSVCSFDVDMKCASATHTINHKCHPHPLTPVQVPIAFACHICLKKEEGLSYKCNVCPFWVHQNCTLIPDAVKHSDHRHPLTLLPLVPSEYPRCRRCDICYSKLFMFQCNYSCVGCLFFAHVGCARSETLKSPSTSRDQNTDGQSIIRLPMKQDSTDLIKHEHALGIFNRFKRFITNMFVGNYVDKINIMINHFDHEHPLFLIDEEMRDNKTCEACAIRISGPSYGCVVGCDYFLHKCCTDLPNMIRHPRHPRHQLTLLNRQGFIQCRCCQQSSNSFCYKCTECEFFGMDIKCGSILNGDVVYHEAHKHPLFPLIISSGTFCTVCSVKALSGYFLKCNTCSFVLCFICAMAPAVIKHRYGGKSKEPFILTYSPPENNHYEDEYLCEICLKDLNPTEWYYHCIFGDQFAHVWCMVKCGADSNIKYEKSHLFGRPVHEHEVTTISCKYDCSPCSRCRHPMRTSLRGAGVGFECKTCNFRRHLFCPSDEDN